MLSFGGGGHGFEGTRSSYDEAVLADPAPPRVILDCDPGLDDAIAIALALRHADVVGITAVGGNVALEHTAANALALCDVLGRPDIAVHAGHDLPMSGSLEHRASEYHGPTGTGGSRFDAPSRPVTSDEAVDWIIDTARGEEGLWMVATGPLTNVAHALLRAPDLVDRFAGISWMGGSSAAGNTTPAAEFNAWVDPEAADVVFRAGHPNLVMLGLNITLQVLLDRPWIDRLREVMGSDDRTVLIDMLDYYETKQRRLTTLAGAAVHDALAVLRVTHPTTLAGVRRPVEMLLDGAGRGMTLVDTRPSRHPEPANVEVVEWADPGAIRSIIFDTLTT